MGGGREVEVEVRGNRVRNKLLTDNDDDDDLVGTPNVQQMRVVPKERVEQIPPVSEKLPVQDAEPIEPLQMHERVQEIQSPPKLVKTEVEDPVEHWGPDLVERLPDVPPSDDGDEPPISSVTEAAPVATTTLDAFSDLDLVGSPVETKQGSAPATTEPQNSNTMQSPQIDFEDLSVGGWTGSPDPKPCLETLPNPLQSPGDEFEKLTKDDFDLGESATLNPNAEGDAGQDVDDFAGDFDDFDI